MVYNLFFVISTSFNTGWCFSVYKFYKFSVIYQLFLTKELFFVSVFVFYISSALICKLWSVKILLELQIRSPTIQIIIYGKPCILACSSATAPFSKLKNKTKINEGILNVDGRGSYILDTLFSVPSTEGNKAKRLQL